MAALGRAIGFQVTMCSGRVLLVILLIRPYDRFPGDDMFGTIPVRVTVRGCKYERYVRYISTHEHPYSLALNHILLKMGLIYTLIHPSEPFLKRGIQFWNP